LVSTVIAGGVSWIYNEIKIDMELARKQYDSILRLDSEISWRVQQFIVAFRTFGEKAGALENFERPQHIFYLFDDYKERPTSSLLRELHDLVDEKQSKDIKSAYNALIFVRYTRLRNEAGGSRVSPKCDEKSNKKKYKVAKCDQLLGAELADGRALSSKPSASLAPNDDRQAYLKSGGNRNCLADGAGTTKSKTETLREAQYREVCTAIFEAFNRERWNYPFEADYSNLASYRFIKEKTKNPHDCLKSHLHYAWQKYLESPARGGNCSSIF
jgi:hypothetical protein